jgi:uncharacterized membrane protein
MTAAAVVLALLLVQLDEHVLVSNGEHRWWLFSGGAAGARGVLSTIAATSMTIATTAFSITIVALQLGSSQFSPRILRGFTGDRGNQVVLGIFVATFAYSLVVLRVVRTETEDQRTFVPGTAVTVSIALAFVMVGALIYFFHHATRSIQAPVIIERAVRDTRELIEGERSRRDEMTLMTVLPEAVQETEWIEAKSAGYIQNIEIQVLMQIARERGEVIRVLLQEGDYVLPGTVLVSISKTDSSENECTLDDEPADRVAEQSAHDCRAEREQRASTVRSAFFLGPERTMEHDVDLGFRQVSDIALKALSPGINDPTTAISCIDRLGELLELTLGLRTGTYAIRDDEGQPRVLIEFDGFEVYLGIAFDQIRHYGAGDVTVMMHLLETMKRLGRASGDPAIQRHLVAMAERVVDETRLQSLPEADRARIMTAALWATPVRA